MASERRSGSVIAAVQRQAMALLVALMALVVLSCGPAAAQELISGQETLSPAAGKVADPAKLASPAPPTSGLAHKPPRALQSDGAAPARDADAVAHDMSPWAMFMGADLVVKSVMVGLAFASLVTWTILLAKSFEFLLAQRWIKQAIKTLRQCDTLGDAERAFAPGRKDVVSRFVQEAADEARLSDGPRVHAGVRERAAGRCMDVLRAESRQLRIGTGLLATIGSTAPFVGLFGTVWGIMNSFVGIAKAQTTNLAVVAPGIAEALFATAIGLVAAIPAVIIYNHFARVTKNHLESVNRALGIVLRLLSRDLDRAQLHEQTSPRA
jgi:biopolymer transport protein ExbB